MTTPTPVKPVKAVPPAKKPVVKPPLKTTVQAVAPVTEDQWREDLVEAIEALTVKRRVHDVWWNYYNGKQPTLWLTDDVEDMFEDKATQLLDNENWCDFAVDAPLKRLGWNGWKKRDAGDDETEDIEAEAIQVFIDANNLELEMIDLCRKMRVAGESFLFVWKDDEKEGGYDISVNDARNVYWPEDSERNKPRFVAKVWLETKEQTWRATLYYEKECIRLRLGTKTKDKPEKSAIPGADSFVLDEPVPELFPDGNPGGLHGFDQVPVFRFAMSKEGISVIEQIRPIQNRINKLEAQKMVAGEFAAIRRLIAITNATVEDGTLNFKANHIPTIPTGTNDDGRTQIWEGSATELENFDKSQAFEIDKLLSKAHVPSHMMVERGKSAPSGKEREAAEGPFIEMIEDLHRHVDASFDDMWTMITGDHWVPVWRNPKIRSDTDSASVVSTFKNAGVPPEFTLEKYAGWTPGEVKELVERPLTPMEAMGAMGQMATAAALGGIDQEKARDFNNKLAGGKTNGAPRKEDNAPPIPPGEPKRDEPSRGRPKPFPPPPRRR